MEFLPNMKKIIIVVKTIFKLHYILHVGHKTIVTYDTNKIEWKSVVKNVIHTKLYLMWLKILKFHDILKSVTSDSFITKCEKCIQIWLQCQRSIEPYSCGRSSDSQIKLYYRSNHKYCCIKHIILIICD
jgi:hypothetical protein